MEQVDCFRYLGVVVHETGRMNEDINHRVREGSEQERE